MAPFRFPGLQVHRVVAQQSTSSFLIGSEREKHTTQGLRSDQWAGDMKKQGQRNQFLSNGDRGDTGMQDSGRQDGDKEQQP